MHKTNADYVHSQGALAPKHKNITHALCNGNNILHARSVLQLYTTLAKLRVVAHLSYYDLLDIYGESAWNNDSWGIDGHY